MMKNEFLRNRFWKKKGRKGFSLAEVLLTVGILCILIAVSFPAIGYFSRLLNQTKLDNTAREIFISAQNKLITMKACGMVMPAGASMGTVPPTDYDTEVIGDWPNQGKATDSFVYVCSDDEGFTFMDDTPMGKNYQEGKYVIEFNRSTGDVYGVFYWEPQEVDFGGSSTFIYASHHNTYTSGEKTYQLRDGKKQRMDSGLKVGYYGGNCTQAMANAKEFEFSREIIDGEKLQLKITPKDYTLGMDTRYVITLYSATDKGKEYNYVLQYVKGAAMGVTIGEDGKETPGGLPTPNVEALDTERGFLITLDSVEAGLHFANLFPEIAAGDDIQIKVQAYYLGSKGIYIAKNNDTDRETDGITQNSLFAGVRREGKEADAAANPKGEYVFIRNGRHLQNLSKEASHLGYTTNEIKVLEKKTSYPIVNANLQNDIDWQDAAYNNNTLYSESERLNSFQPICNYDTGLRIFDGNGWTISNLKVTKYTNSSATNGQMGAGLFGVVYDDTTIKDFKMQDCYVESGSASVGAVVGTFASREATSTKSFLRDIEVIDCTVKMTGNGSSGMLTGFVTLTNDDGTDLASIKHGVYIQNCGVYLSDEHSDAYYQESKTADINHAVTNQGGSAGGLVGYLEKGSLVIQDSFSAVNVYAGASAGGLVGLTNDKLYINNSYSSCIVDSEGESDVGAGGLVGKYTSGWIKAENCFTTCDVSSNCYSGGAFGYFATANALKTATLDAKNIQSYGAVSWKGSICTEPGNTGLAGSTSGGFVGRIEPQLLENVKNLSGGGVFKISNCQYLSMKGYNNSNPGAEGTVIKGYGYDYKNLSYPEEKIKIDITPSLYEPSDQGVQYMPQAELSAEDQKALTHAYSIDLKGYPFPFQLVKRMESLEDSDKNGLEKEYLPYHGNWPRKGEVETALVYYEKYVEYNISGETPVPVKETYGYYTVTTIGEGQSAWTLNTLKSQEQLGENEYLVEDGYALLSTYQLKEFTYTLNGDMGEAMKTGRITISADEPTINGNNGTAQLINGAKQTLLLKQEGAETLKVHAEIYKLPFFLQDISKDKTLEFYDKLEISYTADHKYDETGTLKELKVLASEIKGSGKTLPANWKKDLFGNYKAKDSYTFYYCGHFAKTAINPYVGRTSALRPDRAHEIYVRSARHLNAIGRNPYYWNSTNNSSWTKYAFKQEMDLNFSTYTTRYCGENSFFMNPQTLDGYDRGEYENHVIGRTYRDPITNEMVFNSFQNDYDGGGHQIINFKIYTESLYYVGLFGEVYGSTLEKIHMTTDDDLAELFEDNYTETNGGSYIIAKYTYGKLQHTHPGLNSDGEAHNYGLGALVGKVYSGEGNQTNAVIISNCSVSGFKIIGKMDSVGDVDGNTVNEFPRTSRNYAFHIGGFVGFNNGYITNCSAENKLVQFEFAHPHDNDRFGNEKTLGGFAGSNQGVIAGCYAGGELKITANESAKARIDDASQKFYIGGFSGTNCYAGRGYEFGNTKGVLLKDCYSFCSITKDGTTNQYVPAENIYGVTWTTDKVPTNTNYDNSISECHGSAFSPTPENVANCYYLADLVSETTLSEDVDSNIKEVHAAQKAASAKTAAEMIDVSTFGALLNADIGNESYTAKRGNSDVPVPLHGFATDVLTKENSFPYNYERTLTGQYFVFPAVVKNNTSAYVHFGDWPALNVTEEFLGLCYYEKYGEDDYGYFIRGIDTKRYEKGESLETCLTYKDNLEYDPTSTKRVQTSGYCIATTKAGDTPLSEPPAFENYKFYELPTTGITKNETTGICSMNLPGYNDVTVSYNPDFGAAIKFGTLTQDTETRKPYASDLPAYQVRSRAQLANIGDSKYEGYTFHQTMNINTGEINRDCVVSFMPVNATFDGKGSHFDFYSEAADKLVTPDVPYTIKINIYSTSAQSDNFKYAGLFGSNNGVLRNVNLIGQMVIVYNYVSLLHAGTLTGFNSGIVDGCISQADIDITPKKSQGNNTSVGEAAVGGLIGYNYGTCRFSRVENNKILCGSSIHSKENGKEVYIGGLIGSSDGICQFNSIRNAELLGNGSDLYCKKTNCNTYIGGLIGFAGSDITGCQVFADICNGTKYDIAQNIYIGGFAGKISGGSSKMCGYAGTVKGPTTKASIGQFVGITDSTSVFESCYGWNSISEYPFNGTDNGNNYIHCYFRGTGTAAKNKPIPKEQITDMFEEGLKNSIPSEFNSQWEWKMDSVKNVPILTKTTTP